MRERKHFLVMSGLLSVAFALSITVAYVRIQTTLIGYQLGDLKNQESTLLERRSRLKVELAKLTKKENLTILSMEYQDPKLQSKKALAVR